VGIFVLMRAFFEKIGYETLSFLESYGRLGLFLARTIRSLLTSAFKFRPVLSQVHFIGARSTFVILFTGLFTGMVLGLQGYYTLRKFGSEGFLGSAVALSLIRELGPVLTALMVIGRARSRSTPSSVWPSTRSAT
jgi:phospholipid/cholesterol/gamma-HCH transport system permease protein